MTSALFALSASVYTGLVAENALLGVTRDLPPAVLVVSKSFPILLLALQCARARTVSIPAVAGLVFSAAGDAFLALPDSKTYFVYGLGSFLIAHILYIFHFGFTPLKAERLIIPAAFSAYFLSQWLIPSVKETALHVPILAYVLAITVMGWRAFAYPSRPGVQGGFKGALGALLFLASDAVLSVNKFIMPFKEGHLATMLLYYTGQLLIAKSAMSSGGKGKSE